MAKKKIETVDEYLARGGTIIRIPPNVSSSKEEVLKNQTGGPAVILTLEEADLFYGEAKTSKAKKPKAGPKVDLNALPESLRKKFLAKLRDEENDGEEIYEQEESDEDEETTEEEFGDSYED